MLKKDITVQIKASKEQRPVAMLVQIASQYESSIYMEQDDRHINAKSIMGMMTLGLTPGKVITVIADGSDEAAAVEKLEGYLAC
ncbi:MAG: HPr family phosphocarrier protein [Lachnospiraceae bacterium]|nr:HPr family phosphocarrier protein [Lachnospiraceae bacterium]MBR5348903.1 HPr family phosphocarrier protein [Lachnospiraceae bacterium]MBR6366697.1 HPr family phosphocarrier protein [Lachnospiraceae bacterium]